ncbi:uncharacterized protein LOC135696890 isoform X2 [Ochlerotatus camptorhynchus]|uniref:uncharacterized protein LOC135696890 isoform X2 n=1 Tax=Ochlerotatus camptorhynchus TaxID=644619 RepID=UPI0031D968B6
MAKRKPAIEVEEVLPDDNQLGERSLMWKTFMDKYSKYNEKDNIVFEKVCDMLDYDASDHSNASDVHTDAEAEDPALATEFSREDVENQLVRVVAKRKRGWSKNGLMELMMAVEDGPNMPSHLKVEKWLFNQNTGPFDMTQNRETIVTEKNADGDRMRFYRKEEVTISRDADDADSLSTVDEKKYILQNKKDRNVTSKIKVIQTFRIKTNSANSFVKPKLHSISSFPIHEEEPTTSTSWLNKTSKSDSAFETGEDQSQNRSRQPASRKSVPAPAPSSFLQMDRDNRRKKVFKKTIKKKSAMKSPSKRRSSGSSAQQYESALQRCGTVRKIAQRRVHWQEMSYIAESSSDESDQVFSTRLTRSKAKASPKRELRSKSSSRSSITPEASPRKLWPRNKVISPGKTVDRELVGNFKSICLSPRKKLMNFQPERQHPPRREASVEQTSDLTALFSSANDKISNSTTVGNNTTSFINRSMIPDVAQGIVVYQPKTIQSEAAADAKIRITTKDLELTKVAKARHLDSFQKFDHLIHPNSSVLFFPSDSEDDEPLATLTTTTNSDGDLSFDDDDPILTFKPRNTGRLNVMEYKYH